MFTFSIREMKVYIALDCSMSFLLHSSTNKPNSDKFQRAIKLMCGFVREMATKCIDVNLVRFSKDPKILKYSAMTNADVVASFPSIDNFNNGRPNFLRLRDIILNENVLNDYELIFLLSASQYNWIPNSFHLPCPVRFVLFVDVPNSISHKFYSELRIISAEFCPRQEADPQIVCAEADVDLVLDRLNRVQRLQTEATILISEANRIKTTLLPGLRKLPTHACDGQVLKGLGQKAGENVVLRLLGFTPSQTLLNVASSPLACVVKPITAQSGLGQKDDENAEAFHALAEMLGSNGLVAILQHSETKEEYALKPFRGDPAQLWTLCIQLIPSSNFKWVLASSPEAAAAKDPAKAAAVSYKLNAPSRIHWTDQHGIQSDIQKLHRLLKRNDRLKFGQELQRMAKYAVAFGYNDFAGQFADVLETRCANVSSDSKAQMAKAVALLRKGGFKLVNEQKNNLT